jgi:hypothetical protein
MRNNSGMFVARSLDEIRFWSRNNEGTLVISKTGF